jgi:hypothetical protein
VPAARGRGYSASPNLSTLRGRQAVPAGAIVGRLVCAPANSGALHRVRSKRLEATYPVGVSVHLLAVECVLAGEFALTFGVKSERSSDIECTICVSLLIKKVHIHGTSLQTNN